MSRSKQQSAPSSTTPPPLQPAQSWKALAEEDPAVGRLLKSIYGSKVEVSQAPKFKSVPRSAESTPRFSASGVSTVVPVVEKVNVPVPKFRGPKAPKLSMIETAAIRRRRESDIRQELDRNAERAAAYRPPNIKAIATEDEKIRLAEKNFYGGGKGLPLELTNPAQPIPSELAARRREADRIARAQRRREGLPEESEMPASAPQPTLFDQVANEVEERQQYLQDMKASGLPIKPDVERRIMAEIDTRVAQLHKMQKSYSR